MSIPRFFGECLECRGLQSGRYVGAKLGRWRGLGLGDLGDHEHDAMCREGPDPRQALVEHRTQSVHVGSAANPLVVDLLGGHVGRGPDDRPLGAQRGGVV